MKTRCPIVSFSLRGRMPVKIGRSKSYAKPGKNAFLWGKAMATVTTGTTTLPSAYEWKDLLNKGVERGRISVLTDHRNRLVEFTDGFLEILPMPTDKHQAILEIPVSRLSWLRGALEVARSAFSPLRLQIRPGKLREPDLLLLLSAADRVGKTVSGWARHRLEVVSEEKPEGLVKGRLCRGAGLGILDREPVDRNHHRSSLARRRLRRSGRL